MSRCHAAIVLNDFCYVQGGASKVAIDEAIALQSAGLDVTFLGAVGEPCEALRQAGVRVISLRQTELLNAPSDPTAALRTLWNARAYSAMGGMLRGRDPAGTIVHLHGYTKALTTSPIQAAHRAGFRTVCTLHDFFAACPNGAFYDYRHHSPCTLKPLSWSCLTTQCDKRHPAHKAYRVLRVLAQRQLAQFPARVSHFITLSRRSAEILRPYLPTEAVLHPLSNIIDVPNEPPVEVAANQDFLVLGRLDAEKGVDLAAAAAREAGVAILFAGDGPLRSQLQSSGVRVTGWLDSSQVWNVLGRARCLVFPSRWYEAFGLVVAEAAARGVPAIVSDISAAAERVEHGVTGWIVPSGDISALARAIGVARDDETIRRAGYAAYQRFWSAPSDRNGHVQALLRIYDTILMPAAPAAASTAFAAS